MWIHSTWGAYYICVSKVHVGPQYMWAHNTCGPTIHVDVGHQYMWAYCTCGLSVQVGPQYMCAHNTCGPTTHVGLIWVPNSCVPTIPVGLLYMWAPIHVVLLYMWAYCTCGQKILGAHMYSTVGPRMF